MTIPSHPVARSASGSTSAARAETARRGLRGQPRARPGGPPEAARPPGRPSRGRPPAASARGRGNRRGRPPAASAAGFREARRSRGRRRSGAAREELEPPRPRGELPSWARDPRPAKIGAAEPPSHEARRGGGLSVEVRAQRVARRRGHRRRWQNPLAVLPTIPLEVPPTENARTGTMPGAATTAFRGCASGKTRPRPPEPRRRKRATRHATRRVGQRPAPAGSVAAAEGCPRGASPPRRAARGERRSWLTGAAQLSRPPPAGAGDGRYPGLLSGRPRTGLLSAGDNSGTDRRGGPTSGVRSYPASSGAPATEELPLRQLGQRALTFARSSSGTTGFSTNSCTGSHVSSRSFFVNLPT